VGAQHEQATPGKRGKTPAHQFPEPSLHPVANHRRANRTADNKAYLCRLTGTYLSASADVAIKAIEADWKQQMTCEYGAARTAAGPQHTPEIFGASHPRLLRQHDTSCAARAAGLAAGATSWPAWSGAQLLAALTTARGKDSTASPGTHPQPEAMNLRPPTVVRLERTLAHWSSTSAIRDLLRIQWGQPVNGKGDTGTGQTGHRDCGTGG
jgi:hypothetical protein